jgi:hypothetical protein
LYVDPYSILVTVPGTVKCILLGEAEPTQVTHGSFESHIIGLISLALLGPLTARCSSLSIAQCDMALVVDVLDLAPGVVVAD